MQPLPFTTGFYVSDSLPLSAQECTNWYPVKMSAEARSQESLRGVPGSRQVATSGDTNQNNRGAHVFEGVPYFVNGNVLYRLDRTLVDEVYQYSLTSLGTITGTGRVSMDDNGTQMCIMVPGNPSTGYIFTTGPDTLTTITDLDFKANGEPQYVVYVDGYFVFTTDTKKFICSELNDGLSYNALDFGSAEADPDPTVAPLVLNNQLFVSGSRTFEAYQNIGGAGFPFQRSGLYLPKGLSSRFGYAITSQTFIFIGAGKNETPAIWSFVGNDVEKVSTDVIDKMLAKLTEAELADVFTWAYGQDGSYFVAFVLPTTTLVYDLSTKRWHERKSQLVDARGITSTHRSRINSAVLAYNLVLVGDSQDGRVGILSLDEYREYGTDMVRVVATQPLINNQGPVFVPSLELVMEAGVGTAEVPDPVVRMDRSVTGGRTWYDDRPRKIGPKGDYKRRTIWRRLGRAPHQEVFRFTLSDAVKPVIIGLYAGILGG